jgi:hypothetical protein
LRKDSWEEIDWHAVHELVTIDVVFLNLGRWLQDPREARRAAAAKVVGDLTLEEIAAEIGEMGRRYLRIPDGARTPLDVYRYMRRRNSNFIRKRYLTIIQRERRREQRDRDFRVRVTERVLQDVAAPDSASGLDQEADQKTYLTWRGRLLRAARRKKRLLQLIEYLFPVEGAREPLPQKDIATMFNLTEGRISQLLTELVEVIQRATPDVGGEMIKFTHRLNKKGEKGRARAKTTD